VEAGSNTSAVALLVAEGDEKGTQYREYNRATLFREDICKYGDLALQVGGVSNLKQ
jgi:hypothetical protein